MTVSLALNVVLGAATAGGSPMTVVTRSARATRTVPADAVQLFSSSVSTTFAVSSAHASIQYMPAIAVVGTVSVGFAVTLALAASVGTGAVGVIAISPAPLTVSAER